MTHLGGRRRVRLQVDRKFGAKVLPQGVGDLHGSTLVASAGAEGDEHAAGRPHGRLQAWVGVGDEGGHGMMEASECGQSSCDDDGG